MSPFCGAKLPERGSREKHNSPYCSFYYNELILLTITELLTRNLKDLCKRENQVLPKTKDDTGVFFIKHLSKRRFPGNGFYIYHQVKQLLYTVSYMHMFKIIISNVHLFTSLWFTTHFYSTTLG